MASQISDFQARDFLRWAQRKPTGTHQVQRSKTNQRVWRSRDIARDHPFGPVAGGRELDRLRGGPTRGCVAAKSRLGPEAEIARSIK